MFQKMAEHLTQQLNEQLQVNLVQQTALMHQLNAGACSQCLRQRVIHRCNSMVLFDPALFSGSYWYCTVHMNIWQKNVAKYVWWDTLAMERRGIMLPGGKKSETKQVNLQLQQLQLQQRQLYQHISMLQPQLMLGQHMMGGLPGLTPHSKTPRCTVSVTSSGELRLIMQ